jgi:hypothetical protein
MASKMAVMWVFIQTNTTFAPDPTGIFVAVSQSMPDFPL